MVIFNSYVSLPEGNPYQALSITIDQWFSQCFNDAVSPTSKLVTGAVGICHEIGDRSNLRGIGFPGNVKKRGALYPHRMVPPSDVCWFINPMN